MVLQGFFSKDNGSGQNQEHSAFLNGSLHGEKVLQTDGECVVYGSI